MQEQLEALLENEREAIRHADRAVNGLNGPQPGLPTLREAAEQALAERIEAREKVVKYRAEHGC
jgi:hypothetical protein